MAKNLATMLQSTTVSTELDAVSANKTSANFAKCSLTIMERLVNKLNSICQLLGVNFVIKKSIREIFVKTKIANNLNH